MSLRTFYDAAFESLAPAEDPWDEPTCGICDGLGHTAPCPIEESPWN